METKRIKTGMLALTIFIFVQSHAQKIWDERRGCVDVQGNLAPGYMFEQKIVTAYVDGDMEAFLDDRFAFTGALWVSFATTDRSHPGIRVNEAVLAGANYHFLKPGRFDPFVGFTPGIGLVRASYRSGENIVMTPYSAVPLAGLTIGFNYYVGSIFHFFVKAEGVAGEMFGKLPAPQRLDEIKFMAGLGYNIRMWKPKKHDTWMKAG
jgi:hypothetical protein